MNNRDYVEQMLYDIHDAPLAWQMNFLQGKFKYLYTKHKSRVYITHSPHIINWLNANSTKLLKYRQVINYNRKTK